MTLNVLLTILYIVYAVGVVVFLIMDRRSPPSTFAWLLLMLALPVVGLLIYILTGRSWRAFSREAQYVRKDIGHEVLALVHAVVPPQRQTLIGLRELETPLYNRLLQLGLRSSYALVTTHNCVDILQDAREKYPRLLEDMRNARHSIHIEYFSWATDTLMEEFDNLLLQKVREGVEVRLLFDAMGSFLLFKRSARARLHAGGVQLSEFSPLLRVHTISYRNHRKIVVIDGQVGYVGGLNMGAEHIHGGGPYDAWRDTHLRIEGEAARVLQAQFILNWYHATKQKVIAPEYFPPVAPVLDAQAPVLADTGAGGGSGAGGGTPVQIITSGPDSRYEGIRQMYFYMITTASHHVYIQSPFFVLDASLTEGLKAAAMAGVDIRIMLAPQGTGDNPLPYWAAYTYMLEVIGAGVKIYLYQAGYMHAKTVSVDGLVCSVGSANMDIRSFNIDYEINALVYDRVLAQQLESRFREDLQHCVLFDPREYRKLPFGIRFRDASARLLSPIL